MIIPGFLISVLTFPGVIVHELAHQICCRLCKLAIFDVCYFQFESPCGYVVHEIPKKASSNIIVAIGPFFINTIIGALIAFPAVIPVITFSGEGFLEYFLIWLGISIVIHAFPSKQDLKNMWEGIKDESTSVLTKVLLTPIAGLLYLGSLGSVMWLDLIYAVFIVSIIPNVILAILS